ncbi:MAG: hypothetical protein ACMG6H_01720 [Acidobacteriota bacterium]
MLRRIVLSLALLVSIVVMLPFATSTAHNLRFQLSARSHRFHHHSRAWWRRHRAKLRRRQALLAKRRAALAANRANATSTTLPKSSDNHAGSGTLAFPEGVYREGSFAMPLPSGWSASPSAKGASSFRIVPANGTPEAQAALAVVAVAPPADSNRAPAFEQKKLVGGVSVSDLRRSVIDRMINAGGWVINDRQREIGGHRVFEVIAQTPATSDGKPEQVWNFYFTEINGRVYSLSTRTPGGFTEKVAADAEKFLSAFRPAGGK